MKFVKKVLNRIENNNSNQLTRQKTQSTISVDKSSQNQNMLNTGSNEGRFPLNKIYSISTRISNINIFKYHSIYIIKYIILHLYSSFRTTKKWKDFIYLRQTMTNNPCLQCWLVRNKISTFKVSLIKYLLPFLNKILTFIIINVEETQKPKPYQKPM
jgi:hypothetical protein